MGSTGDDRNGDGAGERGFNIQIGLRFGAISIPGCGAVPIHLSGSEHLRQAPDLIT